MQISIWKFLRLLKFFFCTCPEMPWFCRVQQTANFTSKPEWYPNMNCSLPSELCSCWNLATVRKHGRNIKPGTERDIKTENGGWFCLVLDEKLIICNSCRNLFSETCKRKGSQSGKQKLVSVSSVTITMRQNPTFWLNGFWDKDAGTFLPPVFPTSYLSWRLWTPFLGA